MALSPRLDDDTDVILTKRNTGNAALSPRLDDDIDVVTSGTQNSGVFSAPTTPMGSPMGSPIMQRKTSVSTTAVDNTISPSNTLSVKTKDAITPGGLTRKFVPFSKPEIALPVTLWGDSLRLGMWASNAYAVYLYVCSFEHKVIQTSPGDLTSQKTREYIEFALRVPGADAVFGAPSFSSIHTMAQWAVVIYANYWHLQGHPQFISKSVLPLLETIAETIANRAKAVNKTDLLKPYTFLKFAMAIFAPLVCVFFPDVYTPVTNLMPSLHDLEHNMGGNVGTIMDIIAPSNTRMTVLTRDLCFKHIRTGEGGSFNEVIRPIFIEFADAYPAIMKRKSPTIRKLLDTIRDAIPSTLIVVPGAGDVITTNLEYFFSSLLAQNDFNDQYSVQKLKDIGAITSNQTIADNFEPYLEQENMWYNRTADIFRYKDPDTGEISKLQKGNSPFKLNININDLTSGMMMALTFDMLENDNTNFVAKLMLDGAEKNQITTNDLGKDPVSRRIMFPQLNSLCSRINELDSVNPKYIYIFVAITGLCYVFYQPVKLAAKKMQLLLADLHVATRNYVIPEKYGRYFNQISPYVVLGATMPYAILETTVAQIIAKTTKPLQYTILYSCLTLLCTGTFIGSWVESLQSNFNLNNAETLKLMDAWKDNTSTYYAQLMIAISAFTIHVIITCLAYLNIALYNYNEYLLLVPPLLAVAHANSEYITPVAAGLSDALWSNSTNSTSARFTVRKFRSRTKTFTRHAHFPSMLHTL